MSRQGKSTLVIFWGHCGRVVAVPELPKSAAIGYRTSETEKVATASSGYCCEFVTLAATRLYYKGRKHIYYLELKYISGPLSVP